MSLPTLRDITSHQCPSPHGLSPCNGGIWNGHDELMHASQNCLLARFWLACVDSWVAKLAPDEDPRSISTAMLRSSRRELFVHFRDHSQLLLEAFENEVNGKGLPRAIPGDTSSASTFQTIRTWLGNCVSTHSCGRSPDDYAGFKANVRYLDIREDLVLLEQNVRPTRYACLSHCWGSGEGILKTNRENIQQHFEQGIPMDALPLTFRDAIQVCRNLNINYLWIDSLCIIQNDKKDWQIQASLMSDVYAHAFITIAAAKAHQPSDGCFSRSSQSYIGWPVSGFARVHVRKSLPDSPPIIRRPSMRGRLTVLNMDLDKDYHDWPLLSRAWTYQEMHLSSRILYFAHDQVFWQCLKDSRRECYGDDIIERSQMPESMSESLLIQWHQLVEEYSTRKVTFQEDRLPAIAAVAERMEEARSDDMYLAGLWKNTLLSDLMWYLNPHPHMQGDTERPETASKVPSWSWASLRSALPISFLSSHSVADNNKLTIPTLVEANYFVDGPHMTGVIKQASIVFLTPLIRVRHMKWTRVVLGHSMIGGDYVEAADSTAFHNSRMTLNWAYFHRWDSSNVGPIDSAFIMPIEDCGGLILQRMGVSDVYRRIGFAECELHVGFKQVFNERSHPGARKDLLKGFKGARYHTITLI